MTAAIIAAVAAVIVVVIGLVKASGGRGRRSVDDIDSFRRQINALSPEARRQTSERMKPSERTSTGDDGADDQ